MCCRPSLPAQLPRLGAQAVRWARASGLHGELPTHLHSSADQRHAALLPSRSPAVLAARLLAPLGMATLASHLLDLALSWTEASFPTGRTDLGLFAWADCLPQMSSHGQTPVRSPMGSTRPPTCCGQAPRPRPSWVSVPPPTPPRGQAAGCGLPPLHFPASALHNFCCLVTASTPSSAAAFFFIWSDFLGSIRARVISAREVPSFLPFPW